MPSDSAPVPVSVDDADVRALILRHLALMRAQSPEESCHVMDDSALREADAQLFGYREGDALLGIVALAALDPEHAEIKSMHTAAEARGKGVARQLLRHLMAVAEDRGFARISLETGSSETFAAARALYASEGFEICAPFGAYKNDPLSVYMTRRL